MMQSFRLTMTWLHTWFGLVLGLVLMVAFFFGALSVFDREFDRWGIAQTRFEPQPLPSFDTLLRPVFESIEPSQASIDEMSDRVYGPMPEQFETVRTWALYTTHRDPVLQLNAFYEVPNAREPGETVFGQRTIDPRNGDVVPDNQLRIGSQFFFPLHFSLNLHWLDLGLWLVGIAALTMLVALVSGVVMHRKLFRELFTFRPNKQTQRSTLDLHNLSGVVALPFHFMFAFTGLVIMAGLYFPVTQVQLEPLHERYEHLEEQQTGLPHDRSGVAAPLASVDAMVAEAQHRWAQRGASGEVGLLVVRHVGDANGYVSVFRAGTDRIGLVSEGIHFKASTGEVLYEQPPTSAVGGVTDFLMGLHLQHFRHWMLRWLYVLGGLLGAVCIATGFIFFIEKRKRQHAKQGVSGARVVSALAVTSVTGMVIATLGLLIANRVLPENLAARNFWEQCSFWVVWLLALAHAFWRTAPVAEGRATPVWREQCWIIAVMAVLAVLMNWITTGDHLVHTLSIGYWPVAGIDLSLLVTAVVAVLAANHLRRRASSPQSRSTRALDDELAGAAHV
ncbi:PepSY-associated TM helix domain-containing protein [Steroidobacter sp.]|uniref:PepSY-associated TM helix domain-containing protein n=1 Tax=Steroidobacter sp. TaxID=1978227 RepID=UPI001A5FC6B8|nr:PepSY-associated TM helix domain-containing protein [Steroidobacter sp.]MBL8268318.1 PepSY domain-containing protein [Steroidobacter sp.]